MQLLTERIEGMAAKTGSGGGIGKVCDGDDDAHSETASERRRRRRARRRSGDSENEAPRPQIEPPKVTILRVTDTGTQCTPPPPEDEREGRRVEFQTRRRDDTSSATGTTTTVTTTTCTLSSSCSPCSSDWATSTSYFTQSTRSGTDISDGFGGVLSVSRGREAEAAIAAANALLPGGIGGLVGEGGLIESSRSTDTLVSGWPGLSPTRTPTRAALTAAARAAGLPDVPIFVPFGSSVGSDTTYTATTTSGTSGSYGTTTPSPEPSETPIYDARLRRRTKEGGRTLSNSRRSDRVRSSNGGTPMTLVSAATESTDSS